MIPKEYELAFTALDRIWRECPTDALAVVLGGMRINRAANVSMDPGALDDWRRIAGEAQDASVLELILAYLKLEIRRYRRDEDVPQDLQKLVAALATPGSREREIVDSVMSESTQDGRGA